VAGLAALLVYTGYRLIRQDVKALWRRGGRSEVIIFAATVIAIVSTDLLKGVLLGLAMAIGKLAWTFSRLEIRVEREDASKVTTLTLRGSATFLRVPELTAALSSIPADHEAHIRLDAVRRIDHACFEALESWEKQHIARGGKVFLNWQEAEFRARPGLT
jgi:MFS superfamily sulfate permease-like transporter